MKAHLYNLRLFVPLALSALLSFGCGEPDATVINASVSVPFELLEAGPYEVELTLLSPGGDNVLKGPLPLEYDPAHSVWSKEIENIDDRDVFATVEIVGAIRDSDVVLASAGRNLILPKSAPFAALTFKPSDFDTNLDADADGVTNIQEYLHQFNPFSGDTDGDGNPDLSEIIGGEP